MRFPILTPELNIVYEENSINFIKGQADSLLQTLEKKTLASLVTANRYYEKIPHSILITSNTPMAIYKHCMIQSVKDNDTIRFHHEVRRYRTDQSRLKWHKWRESQFHILENDKFWQNLLQNIKLKHIRISIIHLKKAWDSERFAQYSSNALVEITQNILPFFDNYLKLLRTELKFHKNSLSSLEKNKLTDYIQKLSHEIKKERYDVCEAMLSRLQLASKANHPYFDDIIFTYCKQLSDLNAIKRIEAPPPILSHGLDSDNFLKFHQYILKNGSLPQITKLFSCQWLKESTAFKAKIQSGHILLIPRQLAKHIKANFYSHIFPLQQFSEKILQEAFTFIGYFRMLDTISLPPCETDDFLSHPTWQFLTNLDQPIQDEYLKLQKLKPRNFILKMLLNNRIKFLTDWEKYLFDNQIKILNNKICYAKYVSEQIKTRLIYKLDNELLSTKQIASDLDILINNIQKDFTHLKLSEKDFPEWIECLRLFNNVKSLGHKKISAKPSLELSAHSLQPQNEAPEVIINSPQSEKNLQDILSELSKNLDFEQANHFDSLIEKLNQQLNHISPENQHETKKNIKPYIMPLFITYLKAWTKLTQENHSAVAQKLACLTCLFEQFAPSFIRKRFAELNQTYKKQTWFLFQAKCHAILISLTSTETSSALTSLGLQMTNM